MTDPLTELERDQERRFREGDPFLVEVYLGDHPELKGDAHAVVRLLLREFRLRQDLGEEPTAEEYVARFPEYEDLLNDLLRAERLTPVEPALGPANGVPHLEGYHVVAELGRGGMGTVYKAWHERLRCWVALKTLHGIGGGERLRLEAEAIARLRHPNIVRIHDIGEWITHSGAAPFLVLECVEGGSLARHLGGRPHPPREAAALVETLARAVQHAHEAGIVHRDLKPGNVLMAAPQSPKITDFGLAKDLHAERGLTASGDVLGTPSYMAPEQVRGHGGAIGPSCDVYALGAILYECLTGRPPFQAATNVETVLLVLHQDPVPPRRLQPKLSRDLETICLKCLEKTPSRRYASAAALADDLRRFLGHRPVLARPASVLRRVGKWVRRNPAWAASLAVLLAALTTLAAQWYRYTLDLKYQRDRAERQTGLAVANLRKARETAEQFYLTVRDHKELRAHATETVRLELLRQALALQEQLIEDYSDLPELLAEQARSYHMLGTLILDLRSARDSLPYLRKAVGIAEQLVADNPADLSRQADLASYETTLALRLSDAGEGAEAEQHARRAVDRGEKVVAAGPDSAATFNRYHLASAKVNLGLLLRRQNRPADAEAMYTSAKTDAEAALRHAPTVPDHLNLYGMVCNNLAVLYQRSKRYDLAADAYEEAIRIRTALVEREPGKPAFQQGLAVTWVNAAGLYREKKQDAEAAKAYARAVAVQSRLVEQHPTPRGYRRDLARIHERAGAYSRAKGRISEAAEAYRQVIALRQALADEAPTEAGAARELAEALVAWVAIAPPTEDMARRLAAAADRLRRRADRPEVAKALADLDRTQSQLAIRLKRSTSSNPGPHK